jgi:hypothetical protein
MYIFSLIFVLDAEVLKYCQLTCFEIGILYSTIMGQGELSRKMLETAVRSILGAITEVSSAQVLWNLCFTWALSGPLADTNPLSITTKINNVLALPETGGDLAFDENVLHKVMEAWQLVSGESDGFMGFKDQEGLDYEKDG